MKTFKQATNFVGSNAREFVLITEQGYLMLVNSFTDDLAWDVQRKIVKSYFRAEMNPHNVQEITLSSHDIARMLGKQHGRILALIRERIAELEGMGFNRLEFYRDSTYMGGGGGKEVQPEFRCTLKGCEDFSNKLEMEERRET